jgi:hypothetical protein
MKMFLVLLSAVGFVSLGAPMLGASPAHAQNEYPWCAMSCPGGGGPMCSYATLDQCRASLPGNAGYCERNPRASAPQAILRRSAR